MIHGAAQASGSRSAQLFNLTRYVRVCFSNRSHLGTLGPHSRAAFELSDAIGRVPLCQGCLQPTCCGTCEPHLKMSVFRRGNETQPEGRGPDCSSADRAQAAMGNGNLVRFQF